VKLFPNLNLAKRIAADIGCDDAHEVHRALSRDRYEDLCFAIQSEVVRLRRGRLERCPSTACKGTSR
jgi:hypothetical protein